jgi:hypothetical protein
MSKIGYTVGKAKIKYNEPSTAEANFVKKIYHFAYSIDFNEINIDWNKGKRGPKASNPNGLLAVWIYGYAKGNNSGRKLEKALKQNIDLQYLSKGFLFSSSTLNKFRRALGSCLDSLFSKFVKYEGEPIGALSLDGTQIECAGSHYQFRRVRDLDRLKEKHIKKGNLLRSLEYRKAKEYANNYKGLQTVNLRELDSRFIRHGFKTTMGYNVLVLCDERRFIYGVLVFGSARESTYAQDFMVKVSKNIFLSGKELLADKEFFDVSFIRYLNILCVKSYIPYKEDGTNKKKKEKGLFTKDDFFYDTEKDVYVCPEGEKLKRKGIIDKSKKNPSIAYIKYGCKNCISKKKCLSSDKSKSKKLSRQIGELEKEKLKERMDSQTGKKLYQKRLGCIEPVFSGIKDEKQGNIHRFVLKGKDKVNIEGVLLAISYVFRLKNKPDSDNIDPNENSVIIIFFIYFRWCYHFHYNKLNSPSLVVG